MGQHKTSKGRLLDMDKLILQNKDVRAVGNMNVNAVGDVVTTDGTITSTRAKQVNDQYKKQHSGNVRDIPIKRNISVPVEEPITEVIGLDTEVIVAESVEEATEELTGLASAMSKVASSKKTKKESK